MNTGCLNWKELTATVATRPRACRAASTPPAVSTCDMIQPPKMSPCWLASAGMGTMRRTGSLPTGSESSSVSFMTSEASGIPRKPQTFRALRRRRTAATRPTHKCATSRDTRARGCARGARCRTADGFRDSARASSSGHEVFGACGQLDRERLVFLEVSHREFIETDSVQQTRAQAGREVLSRKGDDRNSRPQRVGPGRVRIPATSVEKQIGEALACEMRRVLAMRREDEALRIDSRPAGVAPQVCFTATLLQPQHAVRHRVEYAHPRSKCCGIYFFVPVKAAEDKAAAGQPFVRAGGRWCDRETSMRCRRVAMRQPNDLFGK